MENENTQLTRVLETSGIEKTKGEQVLDFFKPFFEQASEWEGKVKALVITDPTQLREMKMAREGRLALRDIRLSAEKTKDRLKEASKIEGNFIQAIYNIALGVIAPLEAELLEKEKFVENLEKERIAKLKAERTELIAPYADPNHHWLEGSEEQFNELLTGLKVAHETRIEAERKAEQERIAKEKAEAAERERIRIENELLKAEAAEKEKALILERNAAEKERQAIQEKNFKIQQEIEAKARAEKNAADLEAKRKQAEFDAKMEKEREAREKAQNEREALEKEKADAAAKIEAENKARIVAEKKAQKAPDKAKLLNLASRIFNTEFPLLATDEGNRIAKSAYADLMAIVKDLEKRANEL